MLCVANKETGLEVNDQKNIRTPYSSLVNRMQDKIAT